jgi:hypothetical protein
LSHEICQQFDIILSEDDNPSYWSPGGPPELYPAVIPTPGSITPAIEVDSTANGNDMTNALERLKRLAVPLQEEPRVSDIISADDDHLRVIDTLTMFRRITLHRYSIRMIGMSGWTTVQP